jgi:hypothetical protein
MPRCLVFLMLLTAFPGIGQIWSWQDSRGRERSRADLDAIIQDHQTWLRTRKLQGRRADLHDAKLMGVDLSSVELSDANLARADLSDAKLHATILNVADLSEAVLKGTLLIDSSIRGAHLNRTNLENALLGAADLEGALLFQTRLGGADLSGANLSGSVFEPKVSPGLVSIVRARGIDRLTWDSDPAPVFALRKALLDAGFSDAARKLTAAIRRRNQSWPELILFDWTCEWGENGLRPLKLICAILLCCTLLYWVGMHSSSDGLFLVATGQRISTSKGKERVFPMTVKPRNAARHPSFWARVAWEFSGLGKALLFSTKSALNIGFREFNAGVWLRMIQPRDFDIRARGWMRTLSGVQSLASVALLALSLLSYFGHPFD